MVLHRVPRRENDRTGSIGVWAVERYPTQGLEMTEPSKEAVEAVFYGRGDRITPSEGILQSVQDTERKAIACDLGRALPIERQRWEQEIRERLQRMGGKKVQMLRYAANSIQGQFPGFAINLKDLADELSVLQDDIFGEAEQK